MTHRRTKLHRIAAAALAAAVLGCGDGLSPPFGFEHAAAMRTCGPLDGAALAIVISRSPITSVGNPPTPSLGVGVWVSLEAATGKTWSLGDEAWAVFQARPGSTEAATFGSVRISSVSADSTVTGMVDLRFPSMGAVRGTFSAPLIRNTFLCG
jgi:hypothetical protein